MKSDVTIYLDRPILETGGTVFIIPVAVPNEDWRAGSKGTNPALEDHRLPARQPIGPEDRRIGVLVTSSVSIVRFEFPDSGTFEFRFSPVLTSDRPLDSLVTKHIGTGQMQDYLIAKDSKEDVPLFMTVHVIGPSVTEGDSRVVEAKTKLGFLKERYECKQFDSALSCDASRDITDE